jgi:hypothetical protein
MRVLLLLVARNAVSHFVTRKQETNSITGFAEVRSEAIRCPGRTVQPTCGPRHGDAVRAKIRCVPCPRGRRGLQFLGRQQSSTGSSARSTCSQKEKRQQIGLDVGPHSWGCHYLERAIYLQGSSKDASTLRSPLYGRRAWAACMLSRSNTSPACHLNARLLDWKAFRTEAKSLAAISP